MQPSVKLGRIAGIEIGIHYTWLLIAVLITGSFICYLSNTHPLWPARTTWSAAIVISALFFVSVMLHEMAHALVARAYGMRVRTITLFALGGVTQIEKQAAKPAAEFWMGLAGPLTSAAVGLLCGWLATWGGARREHDESSTACSHIVVVEFIESHAGHVQHDSGVPPGRRADPQGVPVVDGRR